MFSFWCKKTIDNFRRHRLRSDEKDDDTIHRNLDEDDPQFNDYSGTDTLPSSRIWYCGLQVVIILITVLITLELATPAPTNLHNAILTTDEKSFPSGHLSWTQNFTPLPCGNTPTEALTKGCHFDLVATAWLPPKCIDYELAAEFAALHPWQYYSHRNGTDPLPNDADILGMVTGNIWTTDRWHAAHCLFMWKKLNRAIVRGWMTDAETVKLAHTDHCVMNILNMEDPNAIRGVMEVIYPPC
ncbi:hypothetical protein DL98DRAFT_434033 [Cadophora sp. DSE1049]|nr:hypothetical protein DL98DRAFT_434033 [Cadophora sp. DSE1049]